jgi:hypothetical protein
MSDNKTFQALDHCYVVGCGESQIEQISGNVVCIRPENDRLNTRWVPLDCVRESNRDYGTYRCDEKGNRIEVLDIYGEK